MGLFGKSKKEEVRKEEMPQLPSLPKLPDFPDPEEEMQIHGLPSFPSSYLGTKLSQNTIKEAVTGEESDTDEDEADEFADERTQMMPSPLKRPMTEEMGTMRMSQGYPRTSGQGPVFVRIDKFEAAMSTFNEIRRKISEIEMTLEEIRKVREREDRELQAWELEIKSMKDQIEKVDGDIFSKV